MNEDPATLVFLHKLAHIPHDMQQVKETVVCRYKETHSQGDDILNIMILECFTENDRGQSRMARLV